MEKPYSEQQICRSMLTLYAVRKTGCIYVHSPAPHVSGSSGSYESGQMKYICWMLKFYNSVQVIYIHYAGFALVQ